MNERKSAVERADCLDAIILDEDTLIFEDAARADIQEPPGLDEDE
jgi:hypothetical protein